MPTDLFDDRADAGRRLAERLMPLKDRHPVVLALPRGGVPVAFPIARALKAPLDLVLVRKLGAPGNPELAVGAVGGSSQHPAIILNEEVVRLLAVDPQHIRRTAEDELATIERRRADYLQGRRPVAVQGRTVILVDDGIATGATTALALDLVRKGDPASLVLAVPVAPPATLERLRPLCDEIVCLSVPEEFFGVGQFYRDFSQTTDMEVKNLLAGSRQG